MKETDGRVEVDHINGDKLDNRRENLRLVSVRQNAQNSKKHRDGHLCGTTKVKTPQVRQWKAGYKLGKKNVFIGYFLTQQEAHQAYMKACAALPAAQL